jgi:phosphoadenosine phosphosulfate reductase
MTEQQLQEINERFASSSPKELLEWAFQQGEAIVTTNFRPYESVILHLATLVQPSVPALWVDHGTNLPETYWFADKTQKLLNLNLKPYLPKMTSAHWLALNGGAVPMPDEVERVESFSRIMKLEPFERGMKELAPKVWITALRKEQTEFRQSLNVLTTDDKGVLKVAPLLLWSESQMRAYLAEHSLPNEDSYYDPTKALENRECGLHTSSL